MSKATVIFQPVRVEARVRNNVLWHAIFDHYNSVAEFCRKFNLPQVEVGELLNLKIYPLRREKGGKMGFRKICELLSEVLKILPEDLFPLELYQMKFTKAVVEAPLAALPAGDRRELLKLPAPETPFEEVVQEEMRESIAAAMKVLTTREKFILQRRFWDNATLEEVAGEIHLTDERVRVIEMKALKKLRHSSGILNRGLRSFIE